MGFLVALLGRALDRVLDVRAFTWPPPALIGWVLVSLGFLLRVWAAHEFYERQMKVIVLVPQGHLVTTGPFEFTRNPLYLGGNVFIFLGASLVLGTAGGCIVTVLHLPLVHWMIRREEAQLEKGIRRGVEAVSPACAALGLTGPTPARRDAKKN